jgi:hypothetical protein
MARAYGQWVRERGAVETPTLRVIVYVVDPSVIALLSAGHIDLVEQLEDSPLRIAIESIDAFGNSDLQHLIVSPTAQIESLSLFTLRPGVPKLSARPVPTRQFAPISLTEARQVSFRDFGLVSGSTLVADYRVSQSSTRGPNYPRQ